MSTTFAACWCCYPPSDNTGHDDPLYLQYFVCTRYSSNKVSTGSQSPAGILQHLLGLLRRFEGIMQGKLTTRHVKLNGAISSVELIANVLLHKTRATGSIVRSWIIKHFLPTSIAQSPLNHTNLGAVCSNELCVEHSLWLIVSAIISSIS
jgi:hypothetical protein